jgi:hypothetical protein
MLIYGNFIDITEEQYQFIRSKNDNGIAVCVIDGKIQEYVIPESIKLENAKQEKLSELQGIYSKDETWKFTLKDVDGTLTRTSDWLLSKISTKPTFFNDNGEVVNKDFSVEKVFEIMDKINAKSFEILTTKKTLIVAINSAVITSDISSIDIEKEFAKVNKIIDIT